VTQSDGHGDRGITRRLQLLGQSGQQSRPLASVHTCLVVDVVDIEQRQLLVVKPRLERSHNWVGQAHDVITREEGREGTQGLEHSDTSLVSEALKRETLL
jgi:hypothetical protein